MAGKYTSDSYEITPGKRVLIAGGGGFIGSHLSKRLMEEDKYYTVVADWADNIYFEVDDYCSEFHKFDLRDQFLSDLACEDCEEVYDLAADMGGMGFIESNHSLILQNSLRINLNLLASSVKHGVKLFFFSSSACVYPDFKQHGIDGEGGEVFTPNLKEEDAWPADVRSNAYGFEKLVAEEACKWAAHDNPTMAVRIARFHNIFGPMGTWKGGREKAPAAFCRKVLANDEVFPMWGDGLQTRSFLIVDECVEGILRLCRSDCSEPTNIGSDYLISMNDMAAMIMEFEGKELKIEHIPGPQGVRGRNSDNTNIKEWLGWAPTPGRDALRDGLKRTYDWIKSKIEAEKAQGIDNTQEYSGSVVFQGKATDDGDSVRSGKV